MTRTGILTTLSAFTLLAFGPMTFASESAEATAQRDAQVAADYRAEAAELRKKAESHRKLSKIYAVRTKGNADYKSVAKHCEGLAAKYEAAAKDADAVADSFSKQ